jgi:CBS domain-containing protein
MPPLEAEAEMKPRKVVEEVMGRPVVTVPERMWFKEVVHTMAFGSVDCLPVVDAAGKVVGVVTEGDMVLKAAAHRPEERPSPSEPNGPSSTRRKAEATTARELMTEPVVTVRPDAGVAEAAALMLERGVSHLVVVDRAERSVGVLSRRNLVSVFLKSDQEIKAEVEDLLARRLRGNRAEMAVIVQEGIVALETELDSDSLIADTIEEIHEIEGVVAVRTLTRVRPALMKVGPERTAGRRRSAT